MRRTTPVILSLLGAALAGCSHTSPRIEQVEAQTTPRDPANIHSATVKFDYDFTKTPACSPKATAKTCIKQFDVYDVSGGRYKLFTIPAPAGATGVVKGITGQGPSRAFEPGTHFIAVTAENAAGVESDTGAAKVSVEVRRKAVPAPDATPAKQ
jgi:hypothetical protein